MGVTNISSEWVSGSLVFYETAVGRSTTGDVLTLGTTAVTVGNSAQDVDFKIFMGAADQYVLFDVGNVKVTFAKVDVEIDGDLTLDLEDIQLGDNQYLQFGDATGGDVYMSWVSATSLLQILPATDDTGAINIGNGTKDIDFKVFLGSASNYVDFNVGDTQMALVGVDITTDAPVVITDATATSSTSTGALIVTGGIATAADITCGDDLFMSNGGVINFNAGNVTITHSAGALACTGALTISTGTESTSTTTGTLIVTGGIGFSGDMYVGDDIFFASGAVLNFNAGNVTITHAAGALACTGALTLSIATESTSTTTGALIVTGGIGFGGDMYVGDDIFMTATGVINFGAGDVTITGGTNTLAFAGASEGVTFDGKTIVTVASLNATTGRTAKFDGTVLTPNFGDGYGAIECNLNIGTGAVAGYTAGMSSWINLAATTTFAGGSLIAPLDVGVWCPTGATLTNSKMIMGLKMSCVIDDGANPGELYLFNTNIFDNATTALFDINTIVDFTATASAASTGGYKLPFLKERSTGTVWYMNIYTS
jgi:uncharacterized membrane protein YgdD (TMEM256/DUF423 family)